MVQRVIEVTSPEETRALAAALGGAAAPGDVIGLVGDLGAGKTLFVGGLARGLGLPEGAATSPTFTLLHVYQGGRLVLYHADLYRLEREDDLLEVGLDDAYRQDGLVAVEWLDRFPGRAPRERLDVKLEVVGENGRRLTFTGYGARAEALLAALPAG